jgi:hypothetical protein
MPSRSDILKAAETLRRAARLLELQAQRVRDEQHVTHDRAMINARGMIRKIARGDTHANSHTTERG